MTGAAPEETVARLLFPAIRWDPASGFAAARPAAERHIAAGVGGFILFGGQATAVRELIHDLRRLTPRPLLFASDLERGAGQQFAGTTRLPPAAALGSLHDPSTTFRAAALTAREARALGIDWVLAPVADLDNEPLNPIVGTRAFGTDPAEVANQVASWVRGCTVGGALSCAKHFPGHGRTTVDSHVERPRVQVERALLEDDLLPFQAAIEAGVDAIMAAHVAYLALDVSGEAASRSRPILTDLLRDRMGFDGIIATDAINMAGFASLEDGGDAAVRAIQAGCDALLYPHDPEKVIFQLAGALRDGQLDRGRVIAATERLAHAAARLAPASRDLSSSTAGDGQWSLAVARRCVHVLCGTPRLPSGAVRLVTVDDDVGGPHPPPPRSAFEERLKSGGVSMHADGSPVIAVYADVRAWKGRPGLSAAAVARVVRELERYPEAPVVLFAHPRFAFALEGARHMLCAWGGEPLMQVAAAGTLLQIV